ncbi:ATP-binding protein [Algoriphagus sp. AGSA1]|uniref:ATP-binding response regulator n=1 Tax=Algoriphagus sp. AGSA1 TaxID=2907213 RepID=UPI001F23913E|nr:ATP-binding protein [Algoriphagus sp. AGSA1]MCE7056102.1 ATP-binding protein [Algoriphagus sp. AGSA1]
MITSQSLNRYDELSHEIRNSLNIVINSSELLKVGDPEDQGDLVDIINNSAKHLKNLMDSYLFDRKKEYNAVEKASEFDIQGALKDLASQYAILCKGNGLSFVMETDSRIPPLVVGSVTKLTQVLNNLISNAVKFTESGTVKLSVYLQKFVEGTIKVHFAVKDSGCGISSEDQDRLFNNFVQVSGTDSGKGGAGIGLAITRKLLHSMASDIYLSSKKGLGSIFSFSLQFEVRSSYLPKFDRVPRNIIGNKVLVVDEFIINRLVIRKQLDELTVHCDTAESLDRAIDLLRINNYSIILLDANLPIQEGLSPGELIRKEFPSSKIIVVSSGQKQESELIPLGIFSLLPKPFTLHELREALNFELCREGC